MIEIPMYVLPEKLMLSIHYLYILICIFLIAFCEISYSDSFTSTEKKEIKTLIDNRCVTCHGCYDAPCQLKLGSYQGLLRGASKNVIYNPKRLSPDSPTRLFIDAHSIKDWRKKDFFSVTNEGNSSESSSSILQALISQKVEKHFPDGKKLPKNFPLDIKRELTCPAYTEINGFLEKNPMMGMPYGMAPLPKDEQHLLMQWINSDYQDFSKKPKFPEAINEQIRIWEKYFNQSSTEHKLVSRYLYEHLFLGHLSLKNGQDVFYFRLIRSSTPPGKKSIEIATRHPVNDPGSKPFYYRLIPMQETILDKTHLVYSLNNQRMKRWNSLFFTEKWKVKKLPGYTDELATNPFLTFSAIPSESRYRFLLDDTDFFIGNFIKGPVCRGQVALNVIMDYFFVAFLSPDYDLSIVDKNYLKNAIPLLKLPSIEANPLNLAEIWHKGLHEHRHYLEYRDDNYRNNPLTKKGLPIKAIWQGEENSTPALTIFRHFDSASVSKGFIGNNPDSVWVIDYPTLERIYYDLVVNFDVYGNLPHQILTRMYMDYLRMESESLFLSFLPLKDREPILKKWYQGALAQTKIFYGHGNLLFESPSAIHFNSKQSMNELITDIRQVTSPFNSDASVNLSSIYSPLASLQENEAKEFKVVSFLPELSYLIIHDRNGKITKIISLVVNRAHTNVSFIFDEDERRIPEKDRLMLVPDSIGSYLNFIFWVDQDQLDKFVRQAKKITDEKSMDNWVNEFGIRRTNKNIWPVLDKLRNYRLNKEGKAGLLDISRYENL